MTQRPAREGVISMENLKLEGIMAEDKKVVLNENVNGNKNVLHRDRPENQHLVEEGRAYTAEEVGGLVRASDGTQFPSERAAGGSDAIDDNLAAQTDAGKAVSDTNETKEVLQQVAEGKLAPEDRIGGSNEKAKETVGEKAATKKARKDKEDK